MVSSASRYRITELPSAYNSRGILDTSKRRVLPEKSLIGRHSSRLFPSSIRTEFDPSLQIVGLESSSGFGACSHSGVPILCDSEEMKSLVTSRPITRVPRGVPFPLLVRIG